MAQLAHKMAGMVTHAMPPITDTTGSQNMLTVEEAMMRIFIGKRSLALKQDMKKNDIGEKGEVPTMKRFVMVAFLLSSLGPFNAANAALDAKLSATIEFLATNNISNNDDTRATSLGKKLCIASGRQSYECSGATTLSKGICMAGGRESYECSGATTLGKGICMAGGRQSYECSGATTPGKGVCMAGGRESYECSGATTYARGICLARGKESYECTNITLDSAIALPVVDSDWKWDEFRDLNSYGNIWGCRGTATGQFSDESKCLGAKNDNTWPN